MALRDRLLESEAERVVSLITRWAPENMETTYCEDCGLVVIREKFWDAVEDVWTHWFEEHHETPGCRQ